MYVMKDIAHRGCVNSPEYPSPPGVFGSVIPGLYHELWRHRDTRRERRSLAHSLPDFARTREIA